MLCKQPHVCALSWEEEQEAEQQIVLFLPIFEETLCSQEQPWLLVCSSSL